MVKKVVFALMVLAGLAAAPRPAMAGCTTDLAGCYDRASRVDGFWMRWASGLDCELDYTECVRVKILGR
jgi:hypothetical protein